MNLLILGVFLNFFNISMIFPCRDDGSFLFSNALTFRDPLILHFNTPNMDVYDVIPPHMNLYRYEARYSMIQPTKKTIPKL